MYSDMTQPVLQGKEGRGNTTVIRWSKDWSVKDLAVFVKANDLTSLVFNDRLFFEDEKNAIAMCREMTDFGINVLWTAHLWKTPSGDLLQAMRLAGCQRLEMHLSSDAAVPALQAAREFGFDICISNVDGTPYATDKIHYSINERVIIADRFPNLHMAQFELAAAYYEAGRLKDVMNPLGKAMMLGFPMNELCLNLLACLSAAKHYPDLAAGLLDQARYNGPSPIVMGNRQQMANWYATRGDLRGVRLQLDVESRPLA